MHLGSGEVIGFNGSFTELTLLLVVLVVFVFIGWKIMLRLLKGNITDGKPTGWDMYSIK